MSVSSYKNDNVHDALVGIIYVKQTHEFGGVDPADNVFHALNIVGTSSGGLFSSRKLDTTID